MRSKKWFYISVGLVVINLITIFVVLSPKILKKSREDRGNKEQYMAKKLGLSDTQISAMQTLRQGHFKEIKQLERRLFKIKGELFKRSSGEVNSEQLNIDLQSMAQLQVKIDSLTFTHFVEMRAVCSEDQLEKFDEFLSEIMKRGFEGRRGGSREKGNPERQQKPRS